MSTLIDAPNVVEIGPLLVTAGQPTRAALAGLRGQGFEAVVYLAPNTVSDAVPDEPALLQQQDIEFIHIPIPFDAPTESHLLVLSAALARLQGKRVLVHCQVNLRASTMAFLHRVIVLHESPGTAYDAVTKVWSPRGPWKTLVVEQLRKNGIAFDPF